MRTLAKIIVLGVFLTAPFAVADDRHPALDSKYYVSVGGFLASRAFKASAEGSITPTSPTTYVDFESDVKVDDRPDLLVAEFRWQFAEKWNLGLQYFNSTRDGGHTLDESIEWEGVTYEIGAVVAAETKVDITRIVLTRQFRHKEGHDFRLTGGLHWLDISAKVQGEATLGDGSTAFATRTMATEPRSRWASPSLRTSA